jgi:ribulose-phosphate 3-epimerase
MSVRPRIYASTLDLEESDLHTARDRLVAAGVDGFHLDVADGRFVPRRAGSLLLAEALAATGLPFDVHLMTRRPSTYALAYARLGAQTVYIHLESGERELHRAGERAATGGAEPGLALMVETPLDAIAPYADEIRQLLLLGVPAGAGGQPIDPRAVGRLTETAHRYPSLERCHDGGLTVANAATLDAPLLVVGRALAVDDPASVLRLLRSR